MNFTGAASTLVVMELTQLLLSVATILGVILMGLLAIVPTALDLPRPDPATVSAV